MAEMTRRERLMASTLGQRADRLPFFHYWRHSQIGWAERECRNRGMGMNWMRPCFVARTHGVEITEKRMVVDGRPIIRRTYSTPVGSVYEDEYREPGTGQWHGMRSWKDVSPWLTSRIIKGPEDYKVAKYIVENTEYEADYFPVEQAMDWLGDEGVVLGALPHSPMQTMMIIWIGSEEGRVFYHMQDYPDLVDDLYQAMCKSYEPLYEIAAHCPATVIFCGDNIDGYLVTPRIFRKYHMPVYEQQGAILHQRGKLMLNHMDGRLANLKGLIAETPIDVVEAFHTPPMGDLSLRDALAAWPNKAIWIGFPVAIYDLGPQATKEHALEILREAGAGDRVAVAMSTENLVSNENLLALTSVLEKAVLPLAPEVIEGIAREVFRG